MTMTMKFDLSEERLSELAEQKLDEADYIGALKLLHKRDAHYSKNGDSYELAADIYEGMGVYDMAIREWFHFLDTVEPEYYAEAYEGLGVNFMNLGNEAQAAYYYHLLLKTDPDIPQEDKADLLDSFSKPANREFRIVYPPEKADYTKELNSGMQCLRAGDLQQAVDYFQKVHPQSKQFLSARNLEAVCYLLAGQSERAERLCREILSSHPDDIPTLTTLAAVKNEQGDHAASVEIARHLSELPNLSSEELYKIATVCCENGMHEEAYQKFCSLSQEMPYDGNLLYFKGSSAFQAGHVSEAIAAFDLLLTIYPDAEVAKYYLIALRNYKRHGSAAPQLTYFYRVPERERKEREAYLIALSRMRKQDVAVYAEQEGETLDGVLSWCFDEMDGQEEELQLLAASTAIHCGRFPFLKEVLLDFQVRDTVKIEIIRMLAEHNQDGVFGVVICNIYKTLFFYRLGIGLKSRKKFLEGYAACFASFAILSDVNGAKIATAATQLYRLLAERSRYDCMEDPKALAVVIYKLADLQEAGKNLSSLAALMGAELDRVEEILSVVEAKE